MHNQHQTSLSDVSLIELWNPFYLLITIAVIGIYLFYTKNGPWKGSVTRGQKIWFIIGVTGFYIAKGTPLSVIGHHYSFSAHMLQMSLLYFIVPPLLLIGLPKVFFRKILGIRIIGRVFRFFTKPLIALLSFNLLISFYHLPFVFDTVMSHGLLHETAHFILLSSSFFMWWPVIGPLPESDSLSDLQKVGYIFADGVLLTPACALIIFADDLIYQTYMHAPQVFAFLQPLDDQQAGGVIMKIAQEIIYGGILLYILIRWVRKERAQDREDELKIMQEAKANAKAKLSLNEQ